MCNNNLRTRNTHGLAAFLIAGAMLVALLVMPAKAFAKTVVIVDDDDISITCPSYNTPPAKSAPTTGNSCTSGYVIPDSSSRYLSTSELQGYSDWQLYIARNEIYARHGRGFKKANLRNYFNNCSWYTYRYDPDYFDSCMSNSLNDIEQTNAVTILGVENGRNSPYPYGSEYLQP